MGWFIILGAVIVIGAIAFAVYKQKQKWKVLYEEKEMTDDLSKSYNLLLDNEVRCKLLEVAAKEPTVGAAALQAGSGVQSIRLSVHAEDYERAMELIKQSSPHQSYSPMSTHSTI